MNSRGIAIWVGKQGEQKREACLYRGKEEIGEG